MARPFLSEEEHKLRGTVAHASTVGGESPHAPGRPKWGNLPRECRSTFKRICKLLDARQHLTPGDREIISLYAVSENRYWKFKEILDREGWTIEVPDDGTKDHPVAKHFYAAERVMLSCLDRLGLNPLARDKAKQTRKPKELPKDELEQLLERGPQVVPFPVPDVEDEPIPDQIGPTAGAVTSDQKS